MKDISKKVPDLTPLTLRQVEQLLTKHILNPDFTTETVVKACEAYVEVYKAHRQESQAVPDKVPAEWMSKFNGDQ